MHIYSFDRAVTFYDQTRTLPAAVMDEVVGALAAEIRSATAGPVLEVGVGTGRIALPLAERGIEVHGIDVGAEMLAELRRKQRVLGGDGAPVWVCRAEATALPLRDGAYGAVIASLVLHLVGDWRGAVGEMLRTLQPGGVLLVDPDGRSALNLELSRQLERIAGRRLRAGVRDTGELDTHLHTLGWEPHPLGPFTVERRTTVRKWLDALRDNRYSHTWSFDDESREAACDELARWATRRFADLDGAVTDVHTLKWRAYRDPRAGARARSRTPVSRVRR